VQLVAHLTNDVPALRTIAGSLKYLQLLLDQYLSVCAQSLQKN
jgi:hypothetical protein